VAEGAVGFGLAKVILTGEHAVVHGYPAIAIALNRTVSVSLRRQAGPTRLLQAALQDPRLMTALKCVLPETGFGVSIQADFPSGRGLGSSAALAIALVRAKAMADGESLDSTTTLARAHQIETVFHGTPSGLDHTASALGGVIWFQSGTPPVVETLPPPSWQMVVLDSGESGNTAELVARVARQGSAGRTLLKKIGQLSELAREQLHDLTQLGPILNENHVRLTELGVSTDLLNQLVDWARANGASGAKLAGAGGGGVVLAITRNGPDLVLKAQQAGLSATFVTIAEAP
jgi:mevalonate kinase